MIFSLIHPSRGRPKQALECIRFWSQNCSEKTKIEYVLSLDQDDTLPYLDSIPRMFKIANTKVTVSPNKSVVPALNNGAKIATGDVLIYLSDDFLCPQNWDLELEKVIGDKKDFAIWVYDGLQKQVMTIHMLSRSYYQRLGYMYFPDYFSVYADNDITETALKDRVVIDAKHLLFKHNHHSVKNGFPIDVTYKRENSAEAYRIGKELFAKRFGKQR